MPRLRTPSAEAPSTGPFRRRKDIEAKRATATPWVAYKEATNAGEITHFLECVPKSEIGTVFATSSMPDFFRDSRDYDLQIAHRTLHDMPI